MKFVLNEYHQGVTKDELISDVKRVAFRLNKSYLSINEYLSIGKYSYSSFRNSIGSWYKVLEMAELNTVLSSEDKRRISDDDIIQDIKIVAERLHKNTVTFEEYNQNGKYASVTVKERFGSWANILAKANLIPTNHTYPISDQELFDDLEKVWIQLGRQPTTNDMKNGVSKYSLGTYMRRFGGWRGALQVFINYINGDNAVDNSSDRETNETTDTIQPINSPISMSNKNLTFKHRTSRNINLRLRFQVMQRDKFKCCTCGAAPAKDPTVELHVDHKTPWSKDGETEIDNLWTLCSKCNLGKSDLLFDDILNNSTDIK